MVASGRTPTTPGTRQVSSRYGHSPARRYVLAVIIAITVLGFYLRYRCLGCLGFRWDEDLTSLAVKALIEKGVPELPSGMIYLRFYPFQWIIAASVKIFGFSEFSMRLPAVLFGTITIPTSFWVARKLFDWKIGLIVAACIALSFWQVEMARTARMYAPFFLVYLIAAYAIFRAHFQDPGRIFSPWVLPLAILALTIHQLAYSLAILLLLAIPLRKSLARTVSLTAQAGIIGVAFIAIRSIEQKFFDMPRRTETPVPGSADQDGGLIAALAEQVSLPDLSLFQQSYSAFPVALSICVVLVALSALPVIRVARERGPGYVVLVIAAMVMAVTHQFNLVAMLLGIMLVPLKSGIRGMKNPAWYLPALFCISLLVLWLAFISAASLVFAADIPAAGQGYRKLLRALVDYPNFRLFWSYGLERPLLILPLAIGTLWGIDRIARDRPDATALFLVGGFWLVLFANGVLETKFEFFRYNLHVDPLFLMLITAGLFAIPDLVAEFGGSAFERFKPAGATRGYAVIVALIAILGVNPATALLTSTRGYSETSFPYPFLGLDSYDDFKTPAAYVSSHMQEGDVILVLDPREIWNYIGKADYWIRSNDFDSQTFRKDGRAHDLYVGIPVLHSVDDVELAIAGRAGTNAWIIFSKPRMARTPSLSPDLKSFLGGLEENIVYTGNDRQTVVIRIHD